MKILFILSRFPYPLEKGDKLRAYYQIKELSAKHEIVLFALTDTPVSADALAHVKSFCPHVEVFTLTKPAIFFNLLKALFSKLPLQVGYFYSKAAQHKLNALISAQRPQHIFCQLIRTAEYAKSHRDIPGTLDYMDVFSKGVERRLTRASFFIRPVLKMEYSRLDKYEQDVFSRFKNKIIISAQDRDLMQHPDKNKIVIVSNGVDTGYFKPMDKKKTFDILFNGNMNYPPNIEGAEYLVHKILPLVREKYPDVKTLISGTSPGKRIQALASEHVKVSGWVKDIRENFASSKMLVAPMFLSIGLQNKLLEAMAMKVPCITSTLANNALGAENGKSILVADTPEQYARHIISLLDDRAKTNTITENAYAFVLKSHNWKQETEKLEQLIIK